MPTKKIEEAEEVTRCPECNSGHLTFDYERGELIFEEFERLLSPRTKIVAAVHVSNALGTINPVEQIIAAAHARNVPVLVDGAQAAPHLHLDVQALDCDFYTFSGHKVYGPTGIGVLYGKAALLDAMPPYQSGGSMIRSVAFEGTTFAGIPQRFEAGTPHIAGTGVTVRTIVRWYQLGLSPEEIAADYPHLKLAQVYSALAYYHANREEMDAHMDAEEAESNRLEKEHLQGQTSGT